jgi:hypothetical protein
VSAKPLFLVNKVSQQVVVLSLSKVSLSKVSHSKVSHSKVAVRVSRLNCDGSTTGRWSIMNPKVARDVLPLVSNPDFAELIGIYLDEKISEQHKIMEQSVDMYVIYRAQGAASILKRLKSMKAEIQSSAERDK